jgi:hypothetical protein
MNRNIIAAMDDKIVFITPDSTVASSKTIHSKEWISAVSQKTRILARVIKDNNIPTAMLDSDTIVIDDFSNLFDSDYDIQVCRRSKPFLRPDGLVLNCIASFFIVNTIDGLGFIEKWIARMEERIALDIAPPHETPAMAEVLSQKNMLRIGYIDDKIASCENDYIPNITKIVHAKGRTVHDKISLFRFTNIKRIPYKKIIHLIGNKKIAFTILFFLRRIINFYDIKYILKGILKSIIKTMK